MKVIIYEKDNFIDKVDHINYFVISEDEEFFYCSRNSNNNSADWVLDKKDMYMPIMKNAFCHCFGYDQDIIDFQLIKFRLKQLSENLTWKNRQEYDILKRIVIKQQNKYDKVLGFARVQE